MIEMKLTTEQQHILETVSNQSLISISEIMELLSEELARLRLIVVWQNWLKTDPLKRKAREDLLPTQYLVIINCLKQLI